MSVEPQLEGVLDRIIQSALTKNYTARPARVDVYDAATQTVTVTPVLKEYTELDDEEVEVIEIPQIENVPVAFPRAGDWFVSMPITAGDYVLLVFADRSLDVWRAKGGVVDPIDRRRHSVTDAVAIPGVYPDPDKLTHSGIDADMVLGQQGGAVIHIKANGEIHLGQDNSMDFVGLASKIEAQIQAVSDAFDGHEHQYIPYPMGSPGDPVSTTAGPAGVTVAANSTAATKVKAT